MNYFVRALLGAIVLDLAVWSTAMAQYPCDNQNVDCEVATSGGFTKVIANAGYDYAPSIIWDDGKYKMWWCGDGGTPGDKIFYAESLNLDIWTNKQVVFKGSGAPTFASCTSSSAFDCKHTCDPSVVKVRGTYYMYYSGFPVDADHWLQNRQGVATSTDGINWTRQNGGNPILVGKFPTVLKPDGSGPDDRYGAGHSSVVHLGKYFYMTYVDTSINKWNGIEFVPSDGQYAMRSTDYTFQTNVEELRSTGWVPNPNPVTEPIRDFEYLPHAQNADWTYIDSLKQWVVALASHDDLGYLTPPQGSRETRRITYLFFDESLLTEARDRVFIQTEWLEGGGLARYANGHALHNANCSTIPLHFIRPSDMMGVPGSAEYEECWDNQFPPPGGGFWIPWSHCWELGRVHWDYPTGLTSCPNVPLDYDGDSISDQVVFRPGNHSFYIRRSFEGSAQPPPGGGAVPDYVPYPIGNSASIPVSGDFDGDGRADRASVQPNGPYWDWTIHCSSGICLCGANCANGVWTQAAWGIASSDEIAVGDYDNDGRDDVAVFRTTNGTWWIKRAIGGTMQLTFGQAGDRAAHGDFNGDGLLDLGVFRPANGQWRYKRSSDGVEVLAATQGDSSCIPQIGDYNNDGKDDIAYYRTANSKFYFRNLVNGANWGETLGQAGDIPVRGDFNGDGWLDLTVWRPVQAPDQGRWYHVYKQWMSTVAGEDLQYGLNGDKIPDQQ